MSNALLTIIAALSLMASGLRATETQQAEPQQRTHKSMMQSCPMKEPGNDLSVTNTEDGIVLTITTKVGDVAELRRRIEKMATMHRSSSNTPTQANMMTFSVKYEEVDYGARLVLTPNNPAQLDAFRTTVRQHVEQMQKGECPMMQDMMRGMMDGMKNPVPKATPEAKAKPEEEDHSAHHPPGERK